jgi:hypothetical protein
MTDVVDDVPRPTDVSAERAGDNILSGVRIRSEVAKREGNVLKNPKHERFAQELAKGKTATEAYRLAGYKHDDGHASRLAGNGRVSARVDEICGKAAELAQVTVASLIAEAEKARELAMWLGRPSAAVAAVTAKAKLAGLWVEKTDGQNPNVDPDKLTDDELVQRIAELRALSDPPDLN